MECNRKSMPGSLAAMIIEKWPSLSLRPAEVNPMTQPTAYVDLEIRILERQEQGYPIEITFDREQAFPLPPK